jgi:hypothetical protein
VFQTIAELAAEGDDFEEIVNKLLHEVDSRQGKGSSGADDNVFGCSALEAINTLFHLRTRREKPCESSLALHMTSYLISKTSGAMKENSFFIQDKPLMVTSQILSTLTESQQNEYNPHFEKYAGHRYLLNFLMLVCRVLSYSH